MQGPLGRALAGRSDLPWVLLGCLLPDLPWIGRRGVELLAGGTAAYDVRAYAIAQSSLVACCLLAGALAALTPRPGRVFAILAGSSLAHLLLDSLEIKLGNGAVLLAPFRWQLTQLGWFWTESAISVGLTVAGALWIGWIALRSPVLPVFRVTPARVAAAFALGVAYLWLPLVWIPDVEAADLHFIRTLQQRSERSGRPLELDRNAFEPGPRGGSVLVWNGERLAVSGIDESVPRTVSLRGYFLDPGRLEVERVHVHWPAFRDAASYVGLFALLVYWMRGWRARGTD